MVTANKATPEELVQALRDEAKWYTGGEGQGFPPDSVEEQRELHDLLIAAADLIESLQKQQDEG